MAKILIWDSSRDVIRGYAKHISHDGHEVTISTVKFGITFQIVANNPDIVIMNYDLLGAYSHDILRVIKKIGKQKVIVMSEKNEGIPKLLEQAGLIDGYYIKSWPVLRLTEIIASIYGQKT